MRAPISPAPTPSASSAGFTLVEVLVALLVAMTLVGAAGSALIGILRAEEVSLEMLSGTLRVQSLMTARSLHMTETGLVAAVGEDWDLALSELRATKDQTNAWQVLTLVPRESDHPQIQLHYLAE